VLCRVDVLALLRRLREVAEVGADLQVMVMRQDRLTVGGGPGRASSAPPLPVNLYAAGALQRLFDATRAFTEAPVTAQHSLSMLARLAVFNVPNLLRFEPLVPLANELAAAMGDARRMMDHQAPRVYTGPCGAFVESTECFEELWAGEGDVQIHCKVCGTTWDIAARRRSALDAIADQVVSPSEVSRALTNLEVQVTRQDLHYWWRKGLLMRCYDEQGRYSYRVGNVVDAWHTMQERGRGRQHNTAAP
jgi:hypothetical protein